MRAAAARLGYHQCAQFSDLGSEDAMRSCVEEFLDYVQKGPESSQGPGSSESSGGFSKVLKVQ
jgi:hypothetical protein